ncbi:MAG: PEGA domain-containing protein [Proteobacteria bacterium]|nr:PEGA domain-containing protein [Pseudomonadota bacterium]
MVWVRWMSVLFFLILVLFSLPGCVSSVVAVRESESLFSLYVDVEPKEARVIIDDVLYGTARGAVEVPLRVPAGTKRVTIVSEGYYPFRTTLEYVQPGEVYTLKTVLIRSDF